MGDWDTSLSPHESSLFEVINPDDLHDFTDEDRAKLPEESAVASGTVGEGLRHRSRGRTGPPIQVHLSLTPNNKALSEASQAFLVAPRTQSAEDKSA